MYADPGFIEKDYTKYEETELNPSDEVLIEFLEPQQEEMEARESMRQQGIPCTSPGGNV